MSCSEWQLTEDHLSALDAVTRHWESLYADTTIQGYRTRVKWFLAYLESRKQCLTTCGMGAVTSFVRLRRKQAFNTNVAVNSALNRFLSQAKELGLLEWEPKVVERAGNEPRVDQEEVPTKVEINKLFKHLARNAITPQLKRQYALVSLCYNPGMRAREVTNLQLNQVKRDKNNNWELMNVARKKNFTSTIPLAHEAAAPLLKWLDWRLEMRPPFSNVGKNSGKEIPRHWKTSPYVFPGLSRRKPISYRQFRDEVVAAGRQVGLELHPHLLRHCFGTHAVEAGVALPDLRDVMGHRHLSSTNRYLHSTKEGRRKVGEAVAKRLS